MMKEVIALNWALIGYGRVGRALARVFESKGLRLQSVFEVRSISDEWLVERGITILDDVRKLPAEVEVLFICVPDREIEKVIQSLMPLTERLKDLTIAHTAGSLGAAILSPLGSFGAKTLAWHPLQTFNGYADADDFLQGVTIGLDGSEEALKVGKGLAEVCGARWIIAPESLRAIYHLSGVFASNLLTGLIGVAADFLKETGLEDRQALQALEPLIRTTLNNILEQGFPTAITGPAAREDHDTVKRHLEALRLRPEESEIYQSLTRRLLKYLAKEQVGGISTLV